MQERYKKSPQSPKNIKVRGVFRMKNYAIEVFFEQEFDEYVRDLWRQCDSNNLSSFMNEVKGTEPHIALALYENINLEKIEKRFNEFINQELLSFQLVFDAVAFFPTSKVTFLQPNVKPEFVNLMIKIHEHFQEFNDHSNLYYSPERWFPHVTVAKNNTLEELRKTVEFVMERFNPQITRVKRLVLVEIEYIDGIVICRNKISKVFEER
jgi:2'-5' RNA ligase